MDLDAMVRRFLPVMEGPTWIAKRVEILPGVVDSEIIYVSPGMDKLFGYVWPDTLIGMRISEVHLVSDVHITRQHALLRYKGHQGQRHYIMHGTHPNGSTFRLVKHVQFGPHSFGDSTIWVTSHEPWRPSTSTPPLHPPDPELVTLIHDEEFLGYASAAEIQLLLRFLRKKRPGVAAPTPLNSSPETLFAHDKTPHPAVQQEEMPLLPISEPPEISRLPGMQCQKCSHHWTPRRLGTPVICPRCKNPRWWEPRQRQRRSQAH